MLYDDTDRPKALHSRLLLSDVMQERVVQMDYSKQIKALKRQQDEAFLVQQAARLKVLSDGCTLQLDAFCYTTAFASARSYPQCHHHFQLKTFP